MKKNKKILIIVIIIIILLVFLQYLFGGIGISSNAIVIGGEKNIEEIKYNNINKNLYYTDILIDNKASEKKKR